MRKALARAGRPQERASDTPPLLTVRDLRTTFPIRSGVLRRTIGAVRAVDGVSLEIGRGETLGLVGESGSGKSTVARTIIGLEKSAGGSVVFDGVELTTAGPAQFRRVRRDIQMIFQDPYGSLNPRLTVGAIIAEGWQVQPGFGPRKDWRHNAQDLLVRVGLNPNHIDRYPHQFSGGQRQRIGIARALAVKPKLIICDEPVSALDVSVQAQVLNLLQDLQADLGLSYLFIAHDLSVVRHLSDRIAVMYLGRIVEEGTRDDVFDNAIHPYTQALLSAIPITHPWRAPQANRIVLSGDLPSPDDPPSGCRFRTRCWMAGPSCSQVDPVLDPRGLDHMNACLLAEEAVARRHGSRPRTATADST